MGRRTEHGKMFPAGFRAGQNLETRSNNARGGILGVILNSAQIGTIWALTLAKTWPALVEVGARNARASSFRAVVQVLSALDRPNLARDLSTNLEPCFVSKFDGLSTNWVGCPPVLSHGARWASRSKCSNNARQMTPTDRAWDKRWELETCSWRWSKLVRFGPTLVTLWPTLATFWVFYLLRLKLFSWHDFDTGSTSIRSRTLTSQGLPGSCPDSVKFGPTSTKFGPTSNIVGPNLAQIRRFERCFGQLRPNLGDVAGCWASFCAEPADFGQV